MKYQVIKTYTPEMGLSCAFRQWRAKSHCRFLHGYALGVKIVFEAEQLDAKNWVYDFGGMKWIKDFLVEYFDHTTLIAEDDPELLSFKALAQKDLIQLKILPQVGCEKFAEWIYTHLAPQVQAETKGRVLIKSVEVFEQGANSSAILA